MASQTTVRHAGGSAGLWGRGGWALRSAAFAVFVGLWLSLAPPQAGAASPCPSTSLTPGDQNSLSSAVLYCGGTYSDTWNASGQVDWIAFYTTVDDATVVVHYVSTSAPGGSQVGASFYDPGEPPQVDARGDNSADDQDQQGLSYTFATPGIHYVELYPVFGDSNGIGYQISLTGQVSAAPGGAVGPPPGTSKLCPLRKSLTPGDQGSAAWPVLYCGRIYSDTWDGSGESDWLAFYTTVDDATVVVYYVSTSAPGGPQVGASFYDPGSSPGSPSDAVDGNTSSDIHDVVGLSYTFATPGVHYVQLYAVNGDSTGVGYEVELSGQWSWAPASGAVPPPPGTATSCPASATLTPGAQGSAAWPTLYCGGTYTQTWDGSGESDWLAFYTTVDDATVVVHYASTGVTGGPQVGASLFDPGSSPGSPSDDLDGDTSSDSQDPQGVSYTFATPGVHYVHLYSVYGDSTGIGYQVSLSGQWSWAPASGAVSPPPGTATSCPASATLTPGAQGSAAWPTLYCGGTYTQTWDGSGESDWLAFYTTVDDATVVVHYASTGVTGGPQVGASLFDPGSSPGSPSDDLDGDTSSDSQDPQGVSYTFATPGVHYVHLYSVYGDSTGIGYQVSLSGQWSRTPASGAVSPPPGTATSCPASATLTPGAQGSAAWPTLYCGGTYTQTWDGSGESDWLAFYTILADATVVVHYASTGAMGGPHVGASFYDPGSSPGRPSDDLDGDTSGDPQDPQTLSYTFASPGLHYVHLYSVYGDSTGIGYQVSLTGAWSQTPPSTTSPPPSLTAPPKRSSVRVLSHKVTGDTVTLVVHASAAGLLKISGAGLATVVKKVVKAGKLTLEVGLSKVGTTRLKHDHDKLKLTIKVALTPRTLASSSASVTVTLR